MLWYVMIVTYNDITMYMYNHIYIYIIIYLYPWNPIKLHQIHAVLNKDFPIPQELVQPYSFVRSCCGPNFETRRAEESSESSER
jgi:hypothetical protein